MKITSVKATRSKKHGKVKALHFTAMSNGLKSQAMHEPPEDSGMGMMGGMMPGDETMHPSMAHAVKHLKETFGSHMNASTGSGAGPATQPTSTPKGGGPAAEPADDDEDDE